MLLVFVCVFSECMNLLFFDEINIDVFLVFMVEEVDYMIIFFIGDLKQCSEMNDVVVVFLEIFQIFQGWLCGGVVWCGYEDKLKVCFYVVIMLSFVVICCSDIMGILFKVCDWLEYMDSIGDWLELGVELMKMFVLQWVEIIYGGVRIDV